MDRPAPTVEQKLDTMAHLREMAWELSRAGVRMRNPQLSDAAVDAEVKLLFLRASG